MRLLVVLTLLLGALFSMTSTFAVQSAVVSSPLGVTVTTTNAALLSLEPGVGDGNAANTARYLDPSQKALVIDFRRGYGVSQYGLTSNAVAGYKNKFAFKGLFRVTNRSASTQCVTVYVSAGAPEDLSEIRLRTPGSGGGGTQVAAKRGALLSCANLTPGQSYDVDIYWEIDSGGGLTDTFNIRVEGNRP